MNKNIINKIFQYKNIPLIVALLLSVILLSIILYIIIAKKRRKTLAEEFNYRLNTAARTNDLGKQEVKETLIDKFNNWSHGALKELTHSVQLETKEKSGIFIILLMMLIYILGAFILRSAGLATFLPIMALVGTNLLYSKKVKEREAKFEQQIPSFISALKSNIQANQNPENALIDAINTTDYPLYNELRMTKSLTETGSFAMALRTLRHETKNETLKFLCSCIELSSKVGGNLEEQLVTIEKLIEDKQDIKRKTDRAISENTPLIYAASAILPGIFFYMYLTSDVSRDFWFKSLISWIIFFFILILFGSGIYLANRQITKATKL